MKNALITGATKGIGRSIAIAFAEQGINVAICSRNEKDLLDLKEYIRSLAPDVTVVTMVADCSKREEIINFAAFTEKKLGFVDVLINNVGFYQPAFILKDAPGAFQKNIDTNLMPAYELYCFFGERMQNAGKGHIFNICSAVAIQPTAEAGMYSVTKFALLGLNKVMKLEMQQYGVKVTAVIPGSTLTDSWRDAVVDPKRMVLPEDIASAIIGTYQMSAGANVDEIIIKPVFGQL